MPSEPLLPDLLKGVPEDRGRMLAEMLAGMPSDRSGQLKYLSACKLTIEDKAYIVKSDMFKVMYDARLFDMFAGLEEPTRELSKLMTIIGLRIGLAKPVTINTRNVQMASNESRVNIQVEDQRRPGRPRVVRGD